MRQRDCRKKGVKMTVRDFQDALDEIMNYEDAEDRIAGSLMLVAEIVFDGFRDLCKVVEEQGVVEGEVEGEQKGQV